MSLIALSKRRHLWATPGKVIVAGQSNAVNVQNASPAPVAPAGSTLAYDCVGGTSLYTDWQPGQPGQLRETLISLVASAPRNRPVVILWVQGESDQDQNQIQGNTAGSDAYPANFTSLYNAVNGSRASDVLWIMALISALTKYGPQCAVRVKQELLARTLPNIVTIDTDNYALQTNGVGDNLGVHYTNASAVRCWRDALALMARR